MAKHFASHSEGEITENSMENLAIYQPCVHRQQRNNSSLLTPMTPNESDVPFPREETRNRPSAGLNLEDLFSDFDDGSIFKR